MNQLRVAIVNLPSIRLGWGEWKDGSQPMGVVSLSEVLRLLDAATPVGAQVGAAPPLTDEQIDSMAWMTIFGDRDQVGVSEFIQARKFAREVAAMQHPSGGEQRTESGSSEPSASGGAVQRAVGARYQPERSVRSTNESSGATPESVSGPEPMTDEQIENAGAVYGDRTFDGRGRAEWTFDNHGIRAFARAILSAESMSGAATTDLHGDPDYERFTGNQVESDSGAVQRPTLGDRE